MSATVQVLTVLARPAGPYPFGPVAVPTGLTDVDITVDTLLMTNPARSIQFDSEISFDDGGTWQYLVGMTLPGKATPQLDHQGQPIRFVPFGTPLLQPANPLRKVRGTLQIIGGSISIGATVTVGP